MRKFFAVLPFVLPALIGFAQPPTGARGGNQPTGRFYGKLVNSQTGKAVEFASVQLTQMRMDSATKTRKEVIVDGMLTKANGEFSLENVPAFGQYTLKATAIGYQPFEQKVSFEIDRNNPANMMNALDRDLGNLKMEIDEKVLANVTVTGSQPGLKLDIDRKVFNVDKNIVSAGGTAIDVMRNVPSLNVDIDGNVTLRNNSPQIFVDGRPTNLTLEQIPADAIQSVELITNPSAKFDASGGTSGILNIVLKKEKKVGYNGSIRANIDSRARVGLGGDINLRTDKFNVFGNGMFNQRKSISTGTTKRLNLFDDPETYILQKDRSVHLGQFAFGRFGVDYFMSNRNTLSLSLNAVRGQWKPSTESDILIDTLGAPITSSFYERNSDSKGEFRNLGSMLSFKHNFPKPGRELTADITYNRSRNENNSNILTDTFSVPAYTKIGTFNQLQQVNGKNSNLILQTDYVSPINDKSKFEVGARAQIRSTNSTSAFFYADNGDWILQPTSQTNYESRDKVYAAYATYSTKWKTFGMQLGLRAESSDYEGKLLKTGEIFEINFPVSFFPSIFLSKELGETQSMQLNFSRRINRPNFWQLTPITDSSDKLNPNKGNPGLKPEFTNSFELSYEKTFKNRGNFLASVYYKHTTDLITRFQERSTGAGGETIAMNTFINANSSYVTGLELTMRTPITKWWEFTPNFNLYNSDVEIDVPGEPDPESLTSYFIKINNTFKLPKNISIQLSGDYQSKTVLPPGGSGGGRGGMFGGPASSSQGFVRPNYGVDIAVRYEFLKNRAASVSVNMNDIFRTRRYDIHSESSFIIQDAIRRRDAQVVRINFSWRFGKFDPNLFKRKSTRGDQGAGMEGMNMGQ